MAKYIHLEIYKKTVEFLESYSIRFSHFPREYRYTIGEKLMNTIIEFVMHIFEANDTKSPEERLCVLKVMKSKLQYINICLRLADSLHCISKETYARFIETTQNIEMQLTGWYNYTNDMNNKTTLTNERNMV